MASKVEIANRALQRIGAKRISSLDEASNEAREVNAAFDMLAASELSKNFWTFAIKRVQLASDTTTPAFGRAYQYVLPGDFLRRAPDDPTYKQPAHDYLREGNLLLTDYGPAFNLRYVSSSVPAEQWHPLFADALAMRIGAEVCERLTSSGSDVDRLERAYTYFIREARRSDAIEAGPINQEYDELIEVRLTELSNPTLRRLS